jgi:hypothetical protein
MLSNPIIAGPDIPLSEQVRAFCQRHELMDHLVTAVNLARQCFSIIGSPIVHLEQDPEDAEWYLVLDIQVRGEEEDCSNAHRRYLRAWANSVPWPAVHLIRLLYEIV